MLPVNDDGGKMLRSFRRFTTFDSSMLTASAMQ